MLIIVRLFAISVGRATIVEVPIFQPDSIAPVSLISLRKKEKNREQLPRMHVVRVDDPEGESILFLGNRIAKDTTGERQECKKHN